MKTISSTLITVLIAISTISIISPALAQPFYGPSLTLSPATVTSGGTVTALLSSGSSATFGAPPAGSNLCNPTTPSTCFFPLQACDGSLNYYQINQVTVTDPNKNAFLLGSAVTSGMANAYIGSPRYTSAGFAPSINVSQTDSGSIPFGTGAGGFFALTSSLANPPNNVNPEGPFYWWTVAGNAYGSNLRLDQNPSINPTSVVGTYSYDIEGQVFCSNTTPLFFDASMQFTVTAPQVTLSIVKTGASNPAGCSSATGAVGSVMNGGTIAYSVTVSNTGTTGATGVAVSDPQPSGETFGAATATSGTVTQSGGAGSWTWTGDLGVGASVTITWTATVSTSSTSVVNVATITSPAASSTVVINGSPASCTTLVPQLTTSLSTGSISVGGSVTDTATLSGVTNTAGGSITFNVYSDSACTALVTSSSAFPVSGPGTYGPATLSGLASGSYQVQAVYTGDSNNAGATSACGSEPVSVGKLSSSISTQVFDANTNAPWSGSETAPAAAYDTTTITATGPTPSGTVTYTFFSNGACSGTGTSAGTVTLTSTGGVPNSNTESVLVSGSNSFQASYSGDSNYSPQQGTCEVFTVQAPPAAITRTIGYWGNHWRYTQFVLQNDLGGKISWSSGSCSVTLSDTGDVLAGILAGISKTSTGAHRTTLDQDRMILAQQLIGAILNNAAFGSSPGAGVISAAETAYCGTNTTTIINYANQLDQFNSGGDNMNIPASADSCPPTGGFNGKCLSTISDPQGAKSLAAPDIVDWDTPTSINS